MTRCIGMRTSLKEIENLYIATAGLFVMFYMEFHARRIDMPMSLNGTGHMYMVMARVHITLHKVLYLIVLKYLYFSRVGKLVYKSS
jgi:hypothetical protein